MMLWRQNATKKEKIFQRNVWIVLALLFVAFLAKMEAVNFLLTIPIGVWVVIHGYRLEGKARKWASEKINRSFSPFAAFMLDLLLEITHLKIYVIFPVLAGIFSGYFIYSMLNVLFISP